MKGGYKKAAGALRQRSPVKLTINYLQVPTSRKIFLLLGADEYRQSQA
ncbi:MAG: hypothetical protein ACYTXF_36885 [Nostoc sp.]